ncbi:unknown protein [Seminavis robusta]|uniref:Uncharacterized protein n=1 Tax=Seminavis robusta TaxID=568900 RepID=A0A9N8EH75_9STRA|nr:unknown protein [Seminavis robusta]|eukprot:Sro1160_g247770.1 n/a (233) ;mRNA; f:34586-35284
MNAMRFLPTIFAWILISVDLLSRFVLLSLISIHFLLTHMLRFMVAHDGYLFSEAKKVIVLSPPPKELVRARANIIPRPLGCWKPVCDVDGVPSGSMKQVSFRFQRCNGEAVHMQGMLCIERFDSTCIYRVYYEGHESVFDAAGCVAQGDEVAGLLYLPTLCNSRIQDLYGQSKRHGMKVVGLRADYSTNKDSLQFLQFVVRVGYSGEEMAEGIRFQDDFEKAIRSGTNSTSD